MGRKLHLDLWKRGRLGQPPEPGEDGYTGYERRDLRRGLAFLARDEDGSTSRS